MNTQWLTRLREITIFFVLCVAVTLPIFLLVLRFSPLKTYLPFSSSPSKETREQVRYQAVSNVEGFALTLVDIQYLDFITGRLNLFKKDAIVDPRYYEGFRDIKLRFSISKIKFLLVDSLDKPVSTIIRGGGQGKPIVIAGQAGYRIESDTLVVLVQINRNFLESSGSGEYSVEDILMQTITNILYYTKGASDPDADQKIILELWQLSQDYLHGGIFMWPFNLTKIN